MISSTTTLDPATFAEAPKRYGLTYKKLSRFGAFVIFIFCCFPLSLFAQTILFQSNNDLSNAGVVIVQDKRKDLNPDELSLYLKSEWLTRGKKGQAILGKKRIKGQQLIFTPLLPFQPFQDYVAVYAKRPPYFFSLKHLNNYPVTTLEKIYPSPDTLPANLLKIYLHFSAPMSIGNVYRHLTLKDGHGSIRSQAFLELQTELWDPQQQKLTLWLDPGRIKRDLGPNQELGPPLEPGQQYTLVISKTWKDARGIPLGKNYQKTFYVSKADREKPTIIRWAINTPGKATRQALMIKTINSLDQGTAGHPPILHFKEKIVPGSWALQPGEKGWTFHPINTWQSGNYTIQFHESLEDLAGNNLSRLFDQEIINQPKSISLKTQAPQAYIRHFQIE